MKFNSSVVTVIWSWFHDIDMHPFFLLRRLISIISIGSVILISASIHIFFGSQNEWSDLFQNSRVLGVSEICSQCKRNFSLFRMGRKRVFVFRCTFSVVHVQEAVSWQAIGNLRATTTTGSEIHVKQPANSVVVLSSTMAKAVVSRRRPTGAKRNCFAKFEV